MFGFRCQGDHAGVAVESSGGQAQCSTAWGGAMLFDEGKVWESIG